MNQVESIAQAYSQAPWRKQLQMIGLFSMILVVIALVAVFYLHISAEAAKIGREIQKMQGTIEVREREIEDLQSKLAMLMSSAEMRRRAEAMGFQASIPDETMYILISGYDERQPAILAPSSSRQVVRAPVTPPEYSESLLDWLDRSFAKYILPKLEVKP